MSTAQAVPLHPLFSRPIAIHWNAVTLCGPLSAQVKRGVNALAMDRRDLRTQYATHRPQFLLRKCREIVGELIGLRWESVDFHGAFIDVRQTSSEGGDQPKDTQDQKNGYASTVERRTVATEKDPSIGRQSQWAVYAAMGLPRTG